MSQATVTITVEELNALRTANAELTAANADLKARLEKRMHNNIDRLKAYTEAHPEKKAERDKRYREINREAINARRRELRRQKAAAAEPPGQSAAADVPT